MPPSLSAADVAHGLDGVGQKLFACLHHRRIFARNVGGERQAHRHRDVEIERTGLLGETVEVEFLGPQVGELDQPIAALGGVFHRARDPGFRAAIGPYE